MSENLSTMTTGDSGKGNKRTLDLIQAKVGDAKLLTGSVNVSNLVIAHPPTKKRKGQSSKSSPNSAMNSANVAVYNVRSAADQAFYEPIATVRYRKC